MSKSLAILAVSGGLSLLGVSAQAQPSDAVDWSGGYVGLNGGWNEERTTAGPSSITVNQLSGVNAGAGPVSVPPITFTSTRRRLSHDGFMGGGQVGFNGQMSGFVFGAEGDFDGMSGRSRAFDLYTLPATSLTSGSTVAVQRFADPNWTATLRGRAGYGINRALIYATGGVAWVNMRDRAFYTYAPTVTGAVTTANPGVAFGPFNTSGARENTRTGWTVGGGVELMTARNFTVGVEYRHTEVDDWNDNFQTGAPNGVSDLARMRYRDDAVLAKVNLKFSAFGHMF